MPTVDYRADAKALAFNDIVVEALTLSGKARVDADQILVPVAGRAARIRGLDTVAGGTLAAVRLDGDPAYSDGPSLSDKLRLRPPPLHAKEHIRPDRHKGVYQS